MRRIIGVTLLSCTIQFSAYAASDTDQKNEAYKTLEEQKGLLTLQKDILTEKNAILEAQAQKYNAYVPTLEKTPEGKVTFGENNLGVLGSIESFKATNSIAEEICATLQKTAIDNTPNAPSVAPMSSPTADKINSITGAPQNAKNKGIKFYIYDQATVDQINKSLETEKAFNDLARELKDATGKLDKLNQTPKDIKALSGGATETIAITAAINALLQLSKIFKTNLDYSSNSETHAKELLVNQLYSKCKDNLLSTKVLTLNPDNKSFTENPLVITANDITKQQILFEKQLQNLKANATKYKKNKELANAVAQYDKLSTETKAFVDKYYKDEKLTLTPDIMNLIVFTKLKDAWPVTIDIRQDNISLIKENIFGSSIRASSATIANYMIYNNKNEVVDSNVLTRVNTPLKINMRKSIKASNEYFYNYSTNKDKEQ